MGIQWKGQSVKCKVTPLILLVTEVENIPSLEWGKRKEANAAQKFMNIEGKNHDHLNYYPLVCISQSRPCIDATPDNIFICICLRSILCWIQMPIFSKGWRS